MKSETSAIGGSRRRWPLSARVQRCEGARPPSRTFAENCFHLPYNTGSSTSGVQLRQRCGDADRASLINPATSATTERRGEDECPVSRRLGIRIEQLPGIAGPTMTSVAGCTPPPPPPLHATLIANPALSATMALGRARWLGTAGRLDDALGLQVHSSSPARTPIHIIVRRDAGHAEGPRQTTTATGTSPASSKRT
jgi:hypothetical protein